MSFLDNIKAVPITDFAERIGFTTVRKGNKYVSLKEHDSVMIDVYKNCFWRNSRFQKGFKGSAGSIIDFAMEFNGASDYKEAMRQIAQMYGIEGEKSSSVSFKKPPTIKKAAPEKRMFTGVIERPEKAASNNDVFEYLFNERKIDRAVLRYFFAKKMLYQDEHRNCVFTTDRFCCLRSTGKKRFVMDIEGCDYNECFYFTGRNNNDTLVVAESVIDIMSVMSQICREKRRFVENDYLALSGTNKIASVKFHVDSNPSYRKVILCYDNDDAGDKAIQNTYELLKDSGVEISLMRAPTGKDWNEYIKGITV